MRFTISLAAILVVLASPAIADGDPENGEKVFRKCKACHMVGDDAKAKVGPVLNNIFGVAAGVNEEYAGKYSKAMVAAGEEGLVWNVETMTEYLENPRKAVKGTKMAFVGLKKEEEINDVIAYLLQFSPEFEQAE